MLKRAKVNEQDLKNVVLFMGKTKQIEPILYLTTWIVALVLFRDIQDYIGWNKSGILLCIFIALVILSQYLILTTYEWYEARGIPEDYIVITDELTVLLVEYKEDGVYMRELESDEIKVMKVHKLLANKFNRSVSKIEIYKDKRVVGNFHIKGVKAYRGKVLNKES